MDNKILTVIEKYIDEGFLSLIISNNTKKEGLIKVKIRPVYIKGVLLYQAEEHEKNKVFHKNYNKEELIYALKEWFLFFKQAELKHENVQVNILISKKGKASIKIKNVVTPVKNENLEHNRKKNYILEEKSIPFLEDLEIFTKDGKIRKSKYDKFRQINRFLEFIEDIIPSLPKEKTLKIIDFGCGKSYLTFAMYYYLKELKKFDIEITGLDLKKDVIDHCNELAVRYGYDGLRFMHGDIADYNGADNVDMVVTLHACDTATDYALAKAVSWNASVILSVPCCQHEVNKQIKSDLLNPVLKYGIIKERMSALITDAIRADMLETKGYKVQLLEFIDMEHTPKNILIRAVKLKTLTNSKLIKSKKEEINKLLEELSIKQTLYNIFEEKL